LKNLKPHTTDQILHGTVARGESDTEVGPVLTAPFNRIVAVPAVSRFMGIVIAMFFDDHGPPHFHARHADGSAEIRIDTLEPIETTLGRRQLRLVLAWAELH
jgi:Domain of unknown function (DUF4160)